AWTFFVALTELVVPEGCFFAEGFFRLEGTARALGVLPRELARLRFLFGFRVGMAISSSEVERVRRFAVAMDGMSRPSLSSPLLIDLQERHLPGPSRLLFGRRPQPLPRAGLDETGARGPAAPFAARLSPVVCGASPGGWH